MSSHSVPQVLASFGIGDPASKVVQVRFDRHEVHQVKVVQNEVGDSVNIEIESLPYASHEQKYSPDSTASIANGTPYVKPIFETCCNVAINSGDFVCFPSAIAELIHDVCKAWIVTLSRECERCWFVSCSRTTDYNYF